MKKFLQRYKILLIIVILGLGFFISNNVLAVGRTINCHIFKYDSGKSNGECVSVFDFLGGYVSSGHDFKKNDCLMKTLDGEGETQCSLKAKDSGIFLGTKNCFENINYCYDIFKSNIAKNWVVSYDYLNQYDNQRGYIVGTNNQIRVTFKNDAPIDNLQTLETINIVDDDNIVFTEINCTKKSSDKIECTNSNNDQNKCEIENSEIKCSLVFQVSPDVSVGEHEVKVIYLVNRNGDVKTSSKTFLIKISPVNCQQDYKDSSECNQNKYCFFNTGSNKCANKKDNTICKTIPQNLCGTKDGSQACAWSAMKKECVTHFTSSIEERYKKPDGYEGPLPDCAFDGSCADVNKLLELVINIGKWFFSIIGSLAFVFFVYGGFTMILSFGSAEKFKKGQQVLVAAVIGMIIAFGAYALVNFLLTSLGVSDSFIFVK